MRSAVFLTSALLLLCAGCAQTDTKQEEAEYKSPVYRTGSNIPAGRQTGESSDGGGVNQTALPPKGAPTGPAGRSGG
ncbi:MAG: hypothetical protein JSR18_07735 [Proteobacteria bacterium]|nr:hypothetical protein [Pseudomonadota bacterium]